MDIFRIRLEITDQISVGVIKQIADPVSRVTKSAEGCGEAIFSYGKDVTVVIVSIRSVLFASRQSSISITRAGQPPEGIIGKVPTGEGRHAIGLPFHRGNTSAVTGS